MRKLTSNLRKSRSLRSLAAATTGLMTLLWTGCSSPTSSKPPKTACNCEKDGGGSVVKTLTGPDSLVKTAKASGKGVVTGSLAGESKSDVVKGLLKLGRNAAGQERLLSGPAIPLSGATILIFDALRSTTAAETTLTTDRNGVYAAILKPGRYFGYAVHLDLQTFRLVTASIPFMHSVKDTIYRMDTARAIEDNTGPTMVSVHDATSPDASGLFLVGDIASLGGKLNVIFSEPMQRESNRGLVLGKVNTANVNGGLVLKDTLPAASVTMSWSGDSKVLTLALGRLESGSRYGLILPTSLKDLAKNPLEKEYRAAFDVVSEAEVAGQPFTVASTFPLEKEDLKPTQNPCIQFSKPPQVLSALATIQVSPATEGYWEVQGNRLTFVHKDPLKVGQTYTVFIPDSVTDLTGMKLGKSHTWSFTVRDFDGAARDRTGPEKRVALQVEEFFSAYLNGDVGRMAGMLGQTFRLEADGRILSGAQFLDRIRREGADKARLSAGYQAPVYLGGAAPCSTRMAPWKVASVDKRDTLWVQSRTVPGLLPRIFRGEAEITTGITWSKTASQFTLGGRTYVYDLPPSAAGISDNSRSDPRYFGERLRAATGVVLLPVQSVIRDQFTIDGGISVQDLTAKVAVKLTTIARHGRMDHDPALVCSDRPAIDTSFVIVKFILGSDGSRWVFTHAADAGKVERRDFSAAIGAGDFKVREIKPIVLAFPVNGNNGSADTEGKIAFRFRGLDHDSVGGYLAGLAEDPRFIGGRAPLGGVYFIKSQGKGSDHGFVLNARAEASGGATAILREVNSLGLPGWERTGFKYPLTELFNPAAGLAGIYQWKVIAVRDSSASQFLQGGFSPDRFFGESDFGPNIGAFATRGYPTATDFKAIEQQAQDAPAAATAATFSDRDLDGFPDHMEVNYLTHPDDKGSFPNFTVDTDRDGLADFLELIIKPANVEVEATASDRSEFFAALAARKVKWVDSDGDGFPDDIEKLLGYHPADPASKPATRARVPAPTGVFAGLVRLGESSDPISVKFKVRDVEGRLSVAYSFALKDTLADSVQAVLNEAMGEFLFPIRLPENGPDSGRSLLLRGSYDKHRAFLGGAVNRIVSVPRTSVAFGGGPFVGQYAASGRGEDVTGHLGIVKAGSTPVTNPSGTPTAPVTGTPAGPVHGAVLSYRRPPLGLGETARFLVRQGAGRFLKLTLLDEFGDTVSVLDFVASYPQEDGSFDLAGRKITADAPRQSTRRVQMDGRMGRGKDSTTDIWVLDGAVTVSLDSCRRIESGTDRCLERYYRDVAGQFSLKAQAAKATSLANGVSGDFLGWLQQDRFGTGLSDGSTGGATGGTGGTGTGGAGGTGTGDPVPIETFAKPYPGSGGKFRDRVTQAGIAPGEVFYVSLQGRVMRTRNDSLNVMDAPFPHCGNVAIKATPIPLLDGATSAETAAFKRDSALVSGTKYAVLAIDDDAQPGTPARLAKARDALGFVRENVFLIEARYLDPAAFVGDKCIEGGLPPPTPLDAGLPTLPADAAYFRGDIQILASALALSANTVTVTPAGGVSSVARVNPATLRIDPDSRAAMVADDGDPSRNYVLLAVFGKPGTVRSVDNRPSCLAK